MTSTSKAVSAKDMQQRLGLKRYEPVWYMMQKIRIAMGLANEKIRLSGEVELDDAYFTAHREIEPGDEFFNSGRGSIRKQPVLVVVESREGIKNLSAGRLRMEHLPDHRGVTYSKMAQRLLHKTAIVRSDANPSYNSIQPHVSAHQPQKITAQKASTLLPWVHTAISNAKRLFLGIYHHLSKMWLQRYLDEFCFKFNGRRDRKESVYQLFMIISTSRLHTSG
jgi:hypothetical protein